MQADRTVACLFKGKFSIFADHHFTMIQRIQSVYLLLAAALVAGYFVFPFSSKIYVADGGTDIIYRLTLFGVDKSEGVAFSRVDASGLLPVWCIGSGLLAAVAVFLYGNRSLQTKVAWAAVGCCLGVILTDYFLSRAMAEGVGPARQPVYLYASYIPLVQFLMLRLALHRIRKDEMLVRSADRIR